MTAEEFSDQFDVLYNNITSNQAPGLNEYEKSVVLTKAQNEIVKNYFTPNSPGNVIQQGFDDSAKRQADFSCLMNTMSCNSGSLSGSDDDVTYSYTLNGEDKTVTFAVSRIDSRSRVFAFPSDVFIVINEAVKLSEPKGRILQVIPLRYDEYMRLMSKPFKRPLKYQAWRLINQGSYNGTRTNRYTEIIVGPNETIDSYNIRYIKFPKPIIVGNLDGLTIEGYEYDDGTTTDTGLKTKGCELDPILHQDILQRAVELAKVAWTATGQDNLQPMMEAGKRSE